MFCSVFFIRCRNQSSNLISYPEYHRNFNIVKNLVENNEVGQAISRFDIFSAAVNHIPSKDLLFVANACAEVQRCQLCYMYLEKSIDNGLEIDKIKENSSIFQYCNEEVKLVSSKVDNFRFNIKYKYLIDSMFKIDQQVRMQSDLKKMVIVDSMNMHSILNLIGDYGFPSEKLIGKNSAARAFIIFLHMDQDLDNQILEPILTKAFKNGYLAPRQLAWIIDRRRNWGPKKLDPYFYQIPAKSYNSLTKDQKVEIDLRRDSIGLESLEHI